ncbi:MAG: sugar transferase [Clostridia bacterium]|nr:sugar transferase [Clostridia bacterium]
MEWWQILLICIGSLLVLFGLSIVFYKQFFKRFYDIVLSGLALIVLSPLLLILIVVGAIVMRGNPFFTQDRPGKDGKIFKLIKYKSMSDARGEDGELLPDEKRLTAYGRFLRSTSLDELPELFCILCGSMSLIGPRPLLVKYLPLYNEEQRHRHDVRPGLTGYAQAHGRNGVTWEKKFEMDVWYTQHISFFGDIKIILDTVLAVLKRDGISSETSATMEEFKGSGN